MDIVSRLDVAALWIGGSADRNALMKEAAAELRLLRLLLWSALAEHEEECGRFAMDYMPEHWSHAARKNKRSLNPPSDGDSNG